MKTFFVISISFWLMALIMGEREIWDVDEEAFFFCASAELEPVALSSANLSRNCLLCCKTWRKISP